MTLKQLPPEYSRSPIIGWVMVERDAIRHNDYVNKQGIVTHSQRNITTIEAIGVGPCPFNDYDCEDVEWDENPRTHYQGEVKPKITTIPASPGTFKILKEDSEGILHDFCYEVSGIFTDYELDRIMNGGV